MSPGHDDKKAIKDMLCMDVAHSGRSVTGFEFDTDIDIVNWHAKCKAGSLRNYRRFSLGSVNYDCHSSLTLLTCCQDSIHSSITIKYIRK